MKIEENERIDDLQINGLKIIQNLENFCFGIDSILLSDFASKIKKDANVIDLGCGNGIISILLCEKTKLKKITGIEKQKLVADIANKNIILNSLEDKMSIINDDILNAKEYFKPNSIDVVVTNPPYKENNSGLKNENKNKYISRHETTAKISDFLNISKYLLKDNGKVFMVHRPERLIDIIEAFRKNKIEPKRIRFVFSKKEENSKILLIEGTKNGKKFLKVEKPLIIYNDNNHYTNEILKIYNKGDLNK